MPDFLIHRPRAGLTLEIKDADLEFEAGDLLFSRNGKPFRRINRGFWKKVETGGITVVAMPARHLARKRRTG